MAAAKPNGEDLLKLLIELLADQKGVKITYTIRDSKQTHRTDERKIS